MLFPGQQSGWSGVVQFLVLVLVPFPQVWEQGPWDQGDQPPSPECIKLLHINGIIHNKLYANVHNNTNLYVCRASNILQFNCLYRIYNISTGMHKGCASVRIWWLSVQVLSGWDTLQCTALVTASRRGDATENSYGKRGTVETSVWSMM